MKADKDDPRKDYCHWMDLHLFKEVWINAPEQMALNQLHSVNNFYTNLYTKN